MRTCCVCVADTDEHSAKLLVDGLRQNNYDVVAVATGKEALEACTGGSVQVLVADANLPDMGGMALARKLKSGDRSRDIIVMVALDSGAQERFTVDDALDVEEYLAKPYSLPLVMIRIEAILRKKLSGALLKDSGDTLGDYCYTDELTGLRNRRYLMERLQEEVEKAHRYDFPVSCVVFDVQDIEALDDELGPASIDDLLVEIGMVVRNYSRTFDILARYDGSMLVAVLPHADRQRAMLYAQKIIEEVDNTTFSDPCSPTRARLGAGIVACRNGSARGAEHVLAEAMQSLLAAQSANGKRLGARDSSDR